LLKNITLSSYFDVFEKYRELAIRNHYVDLLLVGSLSDPGISDIDCILVLNSWSDIRRSFFCLNPEFFSPLFTHGPFVCPRHLLPDLFKYTTFKQIHSKPPSIQSSYNLLSEQFLVAFRQSRAVPHLTLVLSRFRGLRHALLTLKSALHSLRDCSIFFKDSSEFCHSIDVYSEKINRIRQSSLYATPTRETFEVLKLEALSLLKEASIQMSNWVDDNFYFGLASEYDPLFLFRRAIDGSISCRPKANLDDREIDEARVFMQNLFEGYFVYGALWRGASFPLHFPPEAQLGGMLWVRRFIKHSATLYAKTGF
jgi:hypothetical protein